MKEYLKTYWKNIVWIIILAGLVVGLVFYAKISYKPVAVVVEPPAPIIAPTPVPTIVPTIVKKAVKPTKVSPTPIPTKVTTKAPVVVNKTSEVVKENPMDVAKLLNDAFAFVSANPILVGLIMAIVAFVKQSGWLNGNKLTVCGFGLGIFISIVLQWAAVAAGKPDWASIVINGLAVGLVATGLYKTGQGIMNNDTVAKPEVK